MSARAFMSNIKLLGLDQIRKSSRYEVHPSLVCPLFDTCCTSTNFGSFQIYLTPEIGPTSERVNKRKSFLVSVLVQIKSS